VGVQERLSLEAVSAHTLIAVEHRHRYEFVRPACAGARVLDLCCGTGYGSAIIAEVAASVVGVDRDTAAVDTAQACIAAENVSFTAADALDYVRTLEADDVDLVVCFEGLEHLPDVEEVVKHLARLVAGGVGLVASAPNSATFEEENEFHLTDFDLPAFRELFGVIPVATIAYQSHAEGSLIRGRSAGDVSATVRLSGEQDLDWSNHFLLLAGVDADGLLAAADANLQLAVAPVSHRYMRHLEQANRGLLATNGRLLRERLGLGAGGGASATLRAEDDLAASRRAEAELAGSLEAVRQSEEELQRRLAEELENVQVAIQRSAETRLLVEEERHRAEEERRAAEETLRFERDEHRERIAQLTAQLKAELEAELTALREERDGYRRAWVVVQSSRITRLAARIAGHRLIT